MNSNSKSISNPNSMFRDSSLRLEMNLFRIDFRPEHLSPSFSTKNKFSLVTCRPVNTAVISPRSTSSYSIQIVQPLPELHELVLHAVNPTLFVNDKKHTVMKTNKIKRILWIKVAWLRFGYFRHLALWKLENCNIHL